MDKKSMTVILSAAFLGVCAIGAIAYKQYWDKKHRFIPASELKTL